MFNNKLCVSIIKSTLFYLLYLLSLHKLVVYPRFIHVLYNEYSEDVRGEYSSPKHAISEDVRGEYSSAKYAISEDVRGEYSSPKYAIRN